MLTLLCLLTIASLAPATTDAAGLPTTPTATAGRPAAVARPPAEPSIPLPVPVGDEEPQAVARGRRARLDQVLVRRLQPSGDLVDVRAAMPLAPHPADPVRPPLLAEVQQDLALAPLAI